MSTTHEIHPAGVYGMLAEFTDPKDLVEAARLTRHEGFTRIDAYSPFPIHGLADAIGFHTTKLPLIVLAGGLIGGLGGFFMQYYATTISYPLNIAGRPYNSWPMYIVITFEMTILFAGLSAVLGMLALNGLPQPHHPVFNAPNFELASRTHFFLSIEARDERFDMDRTASFLAGLPNVRSVQTVPMGNVRDAMEA